MGTCGVFMKKNKGIIALPMLLFMSLAVFTDFAGAKETALSKEAVACLSCHAKWGSLKKFQNGETVSTHVDVGEFKACVHNFLTCSSCHTEFSVDKHPKRRFRSLKQYRIMASRSCRNCHPDDEISQKPIHTRLLQGEKEGRTNTCTGCHGAHTVTPVPGGKTFLDEENYCLKCHGYDLNMSFRNGEAVSLKIDMGILETSVHNKLTCSDCHYGFSSEEHPQRNFRTKREYSIASSESCRRCHFDKYTKTMASTHYSVLSQGNLRAPVCTDCHGSHSISRGSKDRAVTTKKCQQCHPEIYGIYARSVHGKALFDEHNQDVPICIDCHKSHDIRNPLALEWHESIPEMCGNCHSNKAVMEKYGFSTDVVKTYLSDFHGITLGFYRKQRESLDKPARPIAVCTDCHGTHNISSTRGTEAAALKVNLVKRCNQCHLNASKDFPDAWLSHYEPNIKNAPLVFIVNLLYKIFIPVMVIGLFLQILLHVWRYAMDR
jgi:nitrate/TMAO reductase-like tetraheme cytochrome c subunit